MVNVRSGAAASARTARFPARLVVGRERAGKYDLTVRLRGTRQVLLQLTCAVPEVTPTLLPTARGLRLIENRSDVSCTEPGALACLDSLCYGLW